MNPGTPVSFLTLVHVIQSTGHRVRHRRRGAIALKRFHLAEQKPQADLAPAR
jgi:hypothetical protein